MGVSFPMHVDAEVVPVSDATETAPPVVQEDRVSYVTKEFMPFRDASDVECCICNNTKVDTAYMYWTCFHKFHWTCALSWLQHSGACPICRFSIMP